MNGYGKQHRILPQVTEKEVIAEVIVNESESITCLP